MIKKFLLIFFGVPLAGLASLFWLSLLLIVLDAFFPKEKEKHG